MKTFNADKLWFTSDNHFGHKNIITYCGRPFDDVDDMTEQLINNWNNCVSEDDDVIMCGDFAWYGITKCREILDRLNGKKWLFIGNHDDKKQMHKLVEEGYLQYCDKYDLISVVGDDEIPEQKLFICHYPMSDWDGKQRGSWMIHGHEHQLKDMPSNSECHYDVGVDKNDFRPISWKELKTIITRQMLGYF